MGKFNLAVGNGETIAINENQKDERGKMLGKRLDEIERLIAELRKEQTAFINSAGNTINDIAKKILKLDDVPTALGNIARMIKILSDNTVHLPSNKTINNGDKRIEQFNQTTVSLEQSPLGTLVCPGKVLTQFEIESLYGVVQKEVVSMQGLKALMDFFNKYNSFEGLEDFRTKFKSVWLAYPEKTQVISLKNINKFIEKAYEVYSGMIAGTSKAENIKPISEKENSKPISLQTFALLFKTTLAKIEDVTNRLVNAYLHDAKEGKDFNYDTGDIASIVEVLGISDSVIEKHSEDFGKYLDMVKTATINKAKTV